MNAVNDVIELLKQKRTIDGGLILSSEQTAQLLKTLEAVALLVRELESVAKKVEEL